MRTSALIAMTTLAAASLGLSAQPVFAQNEGFLAPTPRREQRAAKPAPRAADGRIVIGTVPGEKGHWIRTRRELVAEPGMANRLPSDLDIEKVPFQPWAREMWNYRRSKDDRDSPHARCKPSAGPRQIGTAYGFEIVDLPELKQVIIFDIGGPNSWRTVYMDGRKHPEKLEPSYYGHSIGRWEGDTLVIDTIAYEPNPSGLGMNVPSGLRKHTVERLTLTADRVRLRYEVTVEDPAYLTGPGTLTQQWDHRPDLDFSQDVGACDPEVAGRYREHVPK